MARLLLLAPRLDALQKLVIAPLRAQLAQPIEPGAAALMDAFGVAPPDRVRLAFAVRLAVVCHLSAMSAALAMERALIAHNAPRARLESETKGREVAILASREIIDEAGASDFVEVATIQVCGRQRPVTILTPSAAAQRA